MRSRKHLIACFMSVCLLSGIPIMASADVAPGDVIDKSNWEKVEGLLPEPALNWVKNGDTVLNVGELTYDPKDYLNPDAKASLVTNAGKYDLDAEDLFIDKATGKFPDFLEGIPYPESELDMKDPKVGAKCMYNKFYTSYTQGNLRFPFGAVWVGRSGGFEREVNCEWQQYPMDGFGGHREPIEQGGIRTVCVDSGSGPFRHRGHEHPPHAVSGEEGGHDPRVRSSDPQSPADESGESIGFLHRVGRVCGRCLVLRREGDRLRLEVPPQAGSTLSVSRPEAPAPRGKRRNGILDLEIDEADQVRV